MASRYYVSSALPTVLAADLGASGNPSVVALPGTWPTSYPFCCLLDWGTSAQEAILVTSAPTGTGPYTLPCTRGIDGTLQQAHNAGAQAEHGTTGYEPTQIQALLADVGTLAIDVAALESDIPSFPVPVTDGGTGQAVANEFSVAAYPGADPSGGTASTAAIQDAQAAALAAGGGYVVFGPGTWKTGAITVAGVSTNAAYITPPLVHFRFAGPGATVLTPASANQVLFQVQSGKYAAGVRFEGGFTVKAHASGSTGPAIDLTSARQWVIESPSYLDSSEGTSGSPGTYASVIGFGANTYACRVVSPVCEGQKLGTCFAGPENPATVIANGNAVINPLFESNTATYMIDGGGTAELNVYDGIIEGNTVTAAIRLGYQTRVRGVHFESNAAYAMDAHSADAIDPGTCWLESNVYNTGSGTLTIPSGVNTGTIIIGPLGHLTVSDATDSYLALAGNTVSAGGSLGLGTPLRHVPAASGTTSGTVTLDPKNGDYQRIAPTANVTVGSTTGDQGDGQDLVVEITQPASGGPCAASWSSEFGFAGSGDPPLLSTAASAVDLFAFRWNSAAGKWLETFRRLAYGPAENTCYVSAAAYASDSNDGLSFTTAKATIAGALTALGSSHGVIQLGYGTFTIASADGSGNGATLTEAGTVLRGLGMNNTSIVIGANVTYGIVAKAAQCGMENFTLSAGSGFTVTYGVGVTTTGSAENCRYRDIEVASGAGTVTNCFAVSPDAHADVAGTVFYNCRATSYANAGWIVNDGTAANVLCTHMFGCTANGGTYGVYCAASGFTWHGGDFGENTYADIYLSSMGLNPVTVQGVRSEDSARLLYGTSGTVAATVALRDIFWGSASPLVSSAGDVINYNLAGSLTIDNVQILGMGSVAPVFILGTSGKLTVDARGVQTSAPLSQLFSATPTQSVAVVASAYTQISTTGETGTSLIAGPVRLGASSSSATINGAGRDLLGAIETQTLSSAGAVTINGTAQIAEITLQAHATSSSVTNLYPGQFLTISWVQDATGSRAYSWPSACKFANGQTPPASTAANAVDTVTFFSDGTSLIQCDPSAVQLAGDLGGTLASPQVAKIQGTSISSPPGGTTTFLAGNGSWQVPSGTAGGTLPAVVTPTTTATLANGPVAAFASTSSAGFTITLGSASTAGSGISQYVTKTSTDANTLSVVPPGSETIAGTAQAFILTAENDTLQVMSDGSNWQLVSYKVSDQVITSTATFTVPGGWSLIEATVVGGGAGGGGGGTPSSNIGQVGGSGGTAAVESRALIPVTPALALTCTVGAAGTAGSGGAAGGSPGTVGGQGGTSSITGSGVTTIESIGGWAGTASAASSTSSVANSPWGSSRSAGSSGAAGNNAFGGSGGEAGTGGAGPGGTPVGFASGGGGAGGPASTVSSLGGTAGGPGTPSGGGAGGVLGGSGTANGTSASNAAATSYGAGGGAGGGGATASGTGGNGGTGGPGVIILRRAG